MMLVSNYCGIYYYSKLILAIYKLTLQPYIQAIAQRAKSLRNRLEIKIAEDTNVSQAAAQYIKPKASNRFCMTTRTQKGSIWNILHHEIVSAGRNQLTFGNYAATAGMKLS
jgi:hypothetical protein